MFTSNKSDDQIKRTIKRQPCGDAAVLGTVHGTQFLDLELGGLHTVTLFRVAVGQVLLPLSPGFLPTKQRGPHGCCFRSLQELTALWSFYHLHYFTWSEEAERARLPSCWYFSDRGVMLSLHQTLFQALCMNWLIYLPRLFVREAPSSASFKDKETKVPIKSSSRKIISWVNSEAGA